MYQEVELLPERRGLSKYYSPRIIMNKENLILSITVRYRLEGMCKRILNQIRRIFSVQEPLHCNYLRYADSM